MPSVKVTEHGFSVEDQEVVWSSVLKITAFKRDLLTVDEVVFELQTRDRFLLVSEDQPGFEMFEAALTKVFAEAKNWRQAVIHPAFATNYTVLYARKLAA